MLVPRILSKSPLGLGASFGWSIRWLWVPAALAILIIITRATSVPLRDELHIGGFLPDAVMRGYPEFAELSAQYNDSRPFFPRLAMFLIAVTAGWDTRIEMLLSWSLMLGTTLAVGVIAMRSLPRRVANWCTAYAGIFIFSITQYANILWGAQFILFVPLFCLVFGLVILGGRIHVVLRLAAAVTAGLIATFSMANGFLVWALLLPSVAVMPWATRKARLLASMAWISAATTAVALFFVGFSSSAKPRGSGRVGTVSDLIEFFCVFIGNGLRVFVELKGTLLATALIGGASVLVFLLAALFASFRSTGCQFNISSFRRALPWVSIGCYTLLSGLAITYGRASFGMEAARSERYPTFALPLFVALPPLVYLALQRYPQRGKRIFRERPARGALAVAAVTTALLAIGSVTSWNADFTSVRGWLRGLDKARTAAMFINVAPNTSEMSFLHGNPAYARAKFDQGDLVNLFPWPLLRGTHVEDYLRYSPLPPENEATAKGRIEKAVRINDNITISGFAVNPVNNQYPPDAVAIAIAEPDGRSRLIVHTTITDLARHKVTADDNGHNSSRRWGWHFSFDANLVPPNADIVAFAFDAETRTFSELGGRRSPL